MHILLFIFLSSLFVSSLALIGSVFLFGKHKKITPDILVGFAAGVMLTTAILKLLPEAIHESGEDISLLPVFLSILLFFFLERFVLWFHHHDDTHHAKPTAYLILIGDGVHNFIDGIAIAAAYMTDIRLGILTTIAIAAHEIPQELADAGILVHNGFKPKKALLYNFFSGLTSLVGAGLGYFVLSSIEQLVPFLLSFTTGMFLYISLSDLIPELHQSSHKTSRLRQTIPFLAGCILSLLLIQFIAEGH